MAYLFEVEVEAIIKHAFTFININNNGACAVEVNKYFN